MSTHGVLDENQDHPTWRMVDGQWKTFKYAEAFSRHNRGKHWVDDVNKRRHAPISLESAWGTKWRANRQFTFLLSVAEVNATMTRARAKKVLYQVIYLVLYCWVYSGVKVPLVCSILDSNA